ncbi:MAG: transposase [Pseudomonas sagittaria]|nr:transposase [Pseudomonas sagittaria]
MDTSLIQPPARRSRRRHSPEFRASVIRACQQPGVSMAAVALANGLNANMLRKWVAEAESDLRVAAPGDHKPTVNPSPAFVPLVLTAPKAPADGGDIRIEVRRAGTTVNICWPSTSSEACAAWLRELLR